MKRKSKPLVIITHSLPDEWIASIQAETRLVSGPVDATHLSQEFQKYYPEVEGIYSLLSIPIRKELLDKLPRLRVISNMAAGVDNIDIDECTRRRIPVGHTPGILTVATAELTIALLLSAARRIPEASLDARQGHWKTWAPTGWLGADLQDSTLGIIGMGKIGRAVASRARSIGMNIIYADPTDGTVDLGRRVRFDDLLAQSDFVSLHCPLTPETRGLIKASSLEKMKPEAILVNTSRGQVVNTEDLTSALDSHQIGGAALDVTDPEPLPPNHRLFSIPQCLITPHIGSATLSTRRRIAEMACVNLLAGLEGKKMPHCVNPIVYHS